MTLRTRFAPSPTGRLHLGHARAAFEAFGFAAEQGGTCLLRIEDIDHTRCRPEYTRGIYEDLDWLGLDWPLPVRVQSRHYQDFAKVVIELLERGLAYPCTLTRSDLKAGKRPDPANPLTFTDEVLTKWSDYSLLNIERPFRFEGEADSTISKIISDMSKSEKPELPFAIRLNLETSLIKISDYSLTYLESSAGEDEPVEKEALTPLSDWTASDRPDPIIARRDVGTSYDIAVTHDDALQGITHVVRGQDLEDQTPLHVLLQTLMSWPTPTYYHHDLVLREDGEKLAKRNLDTALSSLREAGQSVAEVRRLAGLS